MVAIGAKSGGAQSVAPNICDGMAIAVSSVCLIHCVGLPVMLLLMPGLAQSLGWPEAVHVFAVLLAIPASTLALCTRWRTLTTGQRQRVAVCIGVGLSLLVAALFAPTEGQETALTVCGSILLVSAHVLNLRAQPAASAPD